jgi:uncharacterized protein
MTANNLFTFQDAIRLAAPKAFTALTKPVGSRCNLDCSYCYYLDKKRFYGDKQDVLPDDLLEKYTSEYLQANEAPQVGFVWHGGEPLLAGIDFFKKAVNFQKKHNTDQKKIENSIQTNGTLLNEEWCRFFRKNNFLVGISIDGTKDIHDSYRKNKSGFGSFDRTMRGLEMLKSFQVDFNTLTVVNKHSHGRGKEIYRFLKSQGVRYMQFLPAIDYIVSPAEAARPIVASPLVAAESELATWSVSTVEYGKFLIAVFNEWVVGDVGKIFVQLFDNVLSAWCGIEPSVCAYRETCGNALVVEHNGDVYSCDHFVYPEHLLGNIRYKPLKEMLGSPEQIDFGLNKRNTLSGECMRCNYYFACQGECPKHRHLTTTDGKCKSSLCDGLKMFYAHTEPYMKFMRELLKNRKPAAGVIPFAQATLRN